MAPTGTLRSARFRTDGAEDLSRSNSLGISTFTMNDDSGCCVLTLSAHSFLMSKTHVTACLYEKHVKVMAKVTTLAGAVLSLDALRLALERQYLEAPGALLAPGR